MSSQNKYVTISGDNELMDRAAMFYSLLLGRKIDSGAKKSISEKIQQGTYDEFKFGLSIFCSNEYLDKCFSRSIDAHLYFTHRARLIMIRRLLPPALNIIDLGGANSPLYHMGYRHTFEKLIMVDLPPDERHDMYKNIEVSAGKNSQITIHYSDMTRLEAFPDQSFELVWSGQSIEHVDLESGRRMCAEAFRILKPGGHFCLDTPNRAMTKIHTQDIGGGFIHPEHKHEYYASELRDQLINSGFEIMLERGVCEMPKTIETGTFHYEDYIIGSPITEDIEAGNIIYFDCLKPNT